MARPRSFDRDVALEKAMLLFWEKGYEETSIGDLTKAMGIAAPSLYAAFGDKRALFDEAVALYEPRQGAGELPQGTDIDVLASYVSTVLAGMSSRARDGATREDLEAIAEVAMGA